MDNIKVSVIVTTKNEEKNIENFCMSVIEQTYKNVELVVVDHSGSTDSTKELAKKYTDKVYSKGPERSAQRNYAVEKATGDYVLILDADMILTKDVVKECVEIIKKNSDVKTVIVPEKSIGNSFWAKCKAFERNFYFLEGDKDIEAARFFERKVLLELGGYDLEITGPEDWELPERIQQKYPQTARTRAYIIHNEGNVSLKRLMYKKYYYALKSAVYLKKANVSKFSAKTIYFLRPVFYKHWQLWFKNPIIGFGTIIMLSAEFIAGVSGFLFSKLNSNFKYMKKGKLNVRK